MTKETAEMLNALTLSIEAQLTDSVRFVKAQEDDEFFKKYRSTVALLLDTLYTDVSNPVYAHYPDLVAESLRRPGYYPERARPFKPTHRIYVSREDPPVEVMLYGTKDGFAHTYEQWASFQAGECISKPFFQRLQGRWWRNNEYLKDVRVEDIG